MQDAETEEEVREAYEILEQVLANCGEVDPAKKVHKYLKDRCGEDNSHPFLTYDDTTACMGPRGLADMDDSYGRETSAKDYAQEIFDECEYASRILIVSANDTSDSGSGRLFEKDEDGNAVEVDYHQGYEGAKGRDVTGYFRENHNISGVASPH